MKDMNLFCYEEHELIRASIRRFAITKLKSLVLQLDEEEVFSVELTCELSKLDLFRMTVSEQYSVKRMDMLSFIIKIEELARIDSSQAVTVAAHETTDNLGGNSSNYCER